MNPGKWALPQVIVMKSKPRISLMNIFHEGRNSHQYSKRVEGGIILVKNIHDEEQSTNIAHEYSLEILTVYISRSFHEKYS